MKKANRIFYGNAPRGTFISLVYGILDLKEQKLQFARAGHNPILFKPAGKEVELLKPSGVGLGMSRGTVFDEKIELQQISLSEGDLLVLYTDGIVEAVNGSREFFGYDRFLRTFKEVSHLDAEQIIQHISDQLYEFIGDAEQHDDMTMIVLKKQ